MLFVVLILQLTELRRSFEQPFPCQRLFGDQCRAA